MRSLPGNFLPHLGRKHGQARRACRVSGMGRDDAPHKVRWKQRVNRARKSARRRPRQHPVALDPHRAAHEGRHRRLVGFARLGGQRVAGQGAACRLLLHRPRTGRGVGSSCPRQQLPSCQERHHVLDQHPALRTFTLRKAGELVRHVQRRGNVVVSSSGGSWSPAASGYSPEPMKSSMRRVPPAGAEDMGCSLRRRSPGQRGAAPGARSFYAARRNPSRDERATLPPPGRADTLQHCLPVAGTQPRGQSE